MYIDMSWITMASGIGIPMLVALVTSRVASGRVKSAMLAALSALAGVVSAAAEAGGDLSALDLNQVASAAVTTFIIATGAHFGVLKPSGVTGSDGAIQQRVEAGIGWTAEPRRGRHAAD